MYISNRGGVITQAMFINCDHSMLTYNFYRKAETIINLFKIRLKTLIKINILPTLILAIGLPILLFVSGGTENNVNYFLLFTYIFTLMIFFSVHHLVLYYLLQPYDMNMKTKSGLYGIVNSLTYLICYFCIQWKAPLLLFTIATSCICILYTSISLYLVYKYAHKRFKLKG